MRINKLKNLDWALMASIGVLLLLGLLEIYSLSPSLAGGFLFFKKQLAIILIGIFFMGTFAFLDYRFLKDRVWIIIFLFLVSIGLLGALFVWGKVIGGSRSWFRVGIFSIEPVEIVKISLILMLAKFFASRHIEISLVRHLITSFFYLLLPFVLVVMQPDFGSAMILVLIWLGIAIVAGMRIKHLMAIFLIGIVLGVLGWNFFLHDYQKARLVSYFNPYQDPLYRGYNVIQSLSAISDGGFWGKGLGSGPVVQLGFLPARHTDFIFASIGEEMGLVGILVLLSAYIVLFWRLLDIALRARDDFGRFLTIGVLLLFIAQCFINLGMNVGIVPVTGISLPLVSYGGSGIILLLVALGLCLSVKVNN